MSNKKKAGFCVYFLAHGGVGRIIQETDDMNKTKKNLKMGQPNNDTYNIVCDADKKIAIKKYNNLLKNSRKKKLKKKSVKKKSVKKKSVKKNKK